MKKLLIVLMIMGGFGLFPGNVQAKQPSSISRGVTVSPAKFELWGSPGSKVSQSIKVTNEASEDMIFAISLENFSVVGEDGEVVLGENASGNHGYLSTWINFDQKSGKLSTGETKLLTYTINIPEKAQSGGKYAAVVISLDQVNRHSSENSGSAKVVSLIMLGVTGSTFDKLLVESFGAHMENNSVNFTLRAANHGNYHDKPTGAIVISNILGKKIAEVPLVGENILPGSTRRMVTKYQLGKHLSGLYTATLIASYGQKGDMPLTATARFWVFSWWQLVGLMAIIGVIILMRRQKTRPRSALPIPELSAT